METTERYCPACRRTAHGRFLDAARRRDARCPNCQALERHRFLAILLDVFAPYLRSQVVRVLDVAPTRIVRRMLESRFGSIDYLGLDLSTGRDVRLRADVTALPFPDRSMDLVLCYHVLEHVPDDAAALAELRRVLRPNGLALLQVPRRHEEATDEGPVVPPETATVRFGQDDHVRWYGHDVEQRLAAAGLPPLVLRPRDLVRAVDLDRLRLDRREEVWLAQPSTEGGDRYVGALDGPLGALLVARGRDLDDAGLLARPTRPGHRTFADLADRAAEAADLAREVGKLRQRNDALAAQVGALTVRAEEAEASYQSLASHPVVRTLRGGKALARRLLGRS